VKPSADEETAAGSGAASAGAAGSGAGAPDDAQAARPRTRDRFKHLELILIVVWLYGKKGYLKIRLSALHRQAYKRQLKYEIFLNGPTRSLTLKNSLKEVY
tara:strand:- start:33 stop:335 length:303 start_codon:yes stop_codon:yes gene_type:complete